MKIELLSGRVFPNVNAARAHFHRILRLAPVEESVADEHFFDLKALYEVYAAATGRPRHPVPLVFFPTFGDGNGLTLWCGVRFVDGSTSRFLIDAALAAIAGDVPDNPA